VPLDELKKKKSERRFDKALPPYLVGVEKRQGKWTGLKEILRKSQKRRVVESKSSAATAAGKGGREGT